MEFLYIIFTGNKTIYTQNHYTLNWIIFSKILVSNTNMKNGNWQLSLLLIPKIDGVKLYNYIGSLKRRGKKEEWMYNWSNKKIQMETLITIRRVLCHNRYTSPALPTTWCIERLQKHSPLNLEPRKSRWASRRPPASPWSRPQPINLSGSRLGIASRSGIGQFPRCTLETFWWTAWGFIFRSFGIRGVRFFVSSNLLVVEIQISCKQD